MDSDFLKCQDFEFSVVPVGSPTHPAMGHRSWKDRPLVDYQEVVLDFVD